MFFDDNYYLNKSFYNIDVDLWKMERIHRTNKKTKL